MTSQLRKINNVIEQFLLPLAEAVSGWSTLGGDPIRAHRHPAAHVPRLSCRAADQFPVGCLQGIHVPAVRPRVADVWANPERRHLFRDVPHHGFLHRPPSDGPTFNHDNPVLRANPVIAGACGLYGVLLPAPAGRGRAQPALAGRRRAVCGDPSSACSPPGCSCISFPSNGCTCICRGDSRYRHPAGLQRLHPRHVDRARVRGPWRGHADICGHVSA